MIKDCKLTETGAIRLEALLAQGKLYRISDKGKHVTIWLDANSETLSQLEKEYTEGTFEKSGFIKFLKSVGYHPIEVGDVEIGHVLT